jgi:hypothetical protein
VFPRLGRALLGHSVITVQRQGWAGIKNGDLLARAEKEFDVFVTVDRKIAIEQDLTRFALAIILLRARTNRLEHIQPLATALLEQLERAPVGTLTVIGS